MENVPILEEMFAMQKKRARSTALVLASASFITITSLVYASIQRTEAEKQGQLALEAQKHFQEAEAQKWQLTEQLENCQGK